MRAHGYYGEPYGSEGTVNDAASRPLDPVGCVQTIRVRDLWRECKKRDHLSFCRKALDIIVGGNMVWLREKKPVEQAWTAKRWTQHVEELTRPAVERCTEERGWTADRIRRYHEMDEATWHRLNPDLRLSQVVKPGTDYQVQNAAILQRCELKDLQCIGKYFAVPKGEEHSRAIWNGKPLGRISHGPPPVFLPYLPDLLEKLGTYIHDNPGCELLTADFRHFFHQIPTNQVLARFFGVALDGKYYCWTSLPMGWSWSPFVAQSVAWAILLAGSDDLWELEPGLDKLPTYVHLKKGGWLTVYYDNLFVVCKNADVMKEVMERIRHNCRQFGARIKPGSWQHRSWKDLPSEPLEYLGAKISRNGDRLIWGQIDKKAEKWSRLMIDGTLVQDAWKLKWTRREVTQIIGRVICRWILSLEPLCDLVEVIGILQRIAKDRWDERTLSLTEPEQTALASSWRRVLENPWHEMETRRPEREETMATDSSSLGWGYVIYDSEGKVVEEQGDMWGENQRSWHIFLKEAIVAIDVLMRRSDESPNTRFVIGIDNAAAASALRNRYSGNAFICKRLTALQLKMIKTHCTYEVVGVRSEDNVADTASRWACEEKGRLLLRRKRSNEKLRQRCWEILRAGAKGTHLGKYVVGAGPGSGTIRHEEILDEEHVDPESIGTDLFLGGPDP